MLLPHERAPLALFGPEVSAAPGALLEEPVIGLRTATVPTAYAGGELQLVLGAPIPADSIVVAPRLVGRAIDGVPSDRNGFVRCQADDSFFGLVAVYAAGDAVRPSEAGGHRGPAGR
jgi:NADH dehydrogenase FAD-containing subunit